MSSFLKSSIITLSILIFTQTWFADNKKELEDIKKLSNNFFSEIYNSLDTSSKSSFRLSLETWISQKTIEDLVNKIDNRESFAEITQYCNNNFKWKPRWTCEENLVEKYYNEEDIIKLQSDFFQESLNNEIWADWDIQNSFFDLVYDLNIIDIILFWEEATIFYYKYWKLWDPFHSSWNKDGTWSTNAIEQINDYLAWNYDNLQNTQTGVSYWSLTETEIIEYSYLEQQYHWSNQEVTNSFEWGGQSCFDPHSFTFNQTQINSNLVANDQLTAMSWSLIITNNINTLEELWISNSVFLNLTNLDSEDLSMIEIWEDWFIDFVDPNEDDEKECSKELYWWLFCLDDLKNEWICTENKNFCIEIKRTVKEQNVLWDSSRYESSSSCINCIVKIMINIIEDNLMWRSIHPRENSNKNWNLPNWMSVFRPMSKIIDISYLTIPWLTGKDPEDLDLKRIKKEREHEEAKRKNTMNCFDRSTLQDNQQIDTVRYNMQECENVQIASKKYTNSSQKKQSRVKSRKTYFDDVHWRFKEFRELFESWIEENIINIPFNKWKNIKSCNEIRN